MKPAWLASLAAAMENVDEHALLRYPTPAEGGRASAVLIALSDAENGPGVLLIERATGMRQHAGQIAFPGGAQDPDDVDAVATALREASEEVGVVADTVEVVGLLPELYLAPSRFLVTPVVAWWARPHPVGVVDAREVASVAVVPIAELADPANRFRVRHPSGYTGPGFEVNGWFVWGFTGGLLDALLTLGGWALPWDATVVRPLPGPLGTVQP